MNNDLTSWVLVGIAVCLIAIMIFATINGDQAMCVALGAIGLLVIMRLTTRLTIARLQKEINELREALGGKG